MEINSVSEASARDALEIKGLQVDCLVGIYPNEFQTLQPLVVDLVLHLDTRPAAQSQCLTKSVDYAALSAEIAFILQSAHYKLLETAAEALCHYVLAPPPLDRPRGNVEGVTLKLVKPEAFGQAQTPSLTVRRSRKEVTVEAKETPVGAVEVIHQSKDSVIYRQWVPPMGKTPFYQQSQGDIAEMPLSKGLYLDGQQLVPGTSRSYQPQMVRQYVNPSPEPRSLLCVAKEGLSLIQAKPDDSLLSRGVIETRSYFHASTEASTHYY